MAPQANQALPEGTRLDKYRIVRTLAAGGFSIVYLAHDDNDSPVDIKPANVFLRTDGSPLLIDFGAARQTLSAEGAKLPPTYTVGFAAPEQYARAGELGPW